IKESGSMMVAGFRNCCNPNDFNRVTSTTKEVSTTCLLCEEPVLMTMLTTDEES
ncbi:hypothetical protein P7K49_025530, partial [Saguinus oedipus]